MPCDEKSEGSRNDAPPSDPTAMLLKPDAGAETTALPPLPAETTSATDEFWRASPSIASDSVETAAASPPPQLLLITSGLLTPAPSPVPWKNAR